VPWHECYAMDESLKLVAQLALGSAAEQCGIRADPIHGTGDGGAAGGTRGRFNGGPTGVWPCMKHEIPALLASGGGAIVHDSSGHGLAGTAIGNVPCVAAKHGVIGLTKSAAIDYALQGTRVNAVCPDWTHSEMVDPALKALPDVFDSIVTNEIPMRRIGDAVEIARSVLWLCSDESSYVTGQSLVVYGGPRAR
jgi:A-factor type gamma-butyrolactone 1'-reductase (1S-forming)